MSSRQLNCVAASCGPIWPEACSRVPEVWAKAHTWMGVNRKVPSHVFWVILQASDELFHVSALEADLVDGREQRKAAKTKVAR